MNTESKPSHKCKSSRAIYSLAMVFMSKTGGFSKSRSSDLDSTSCFTMEPSGVKSDEMSHETSASFCYSFILLSVTSCACRAPFLHPKYCCKLDELASASDLNPRDAIYDDRNMMNAMIAKMTLAELMEI